jgi:hypothetical protein
MGLQLLRYERYQFIDRKAAADMSFFGRLLFKRERRATP